MHTISIMLIWQTQVVETRENIIIDNTQEGYDYNILPYNPWDLTTKIENGAPKTVHFNFSLNFLKIKIIGALFQKISLAEQRLSPGQDS